MPLENMHDTYSPLLKPGELTLRDLEYVDHVLRETSLADMAEWTETRLRTYELLNGQRFRMVVDRPADHDPDKVVIVAGEYGKGTDLDHIIRARLVRDMAAPDAALVFQPTATADHPRDYMNYSDDERRQLRGGDIDPIMGRLALVLGRDVPTQTVYGSSQGGMVALDYAAHPDTPAAAVAAFEPPNVVDRSTLKLMKDFVGNSGALVERFRENGQEPTPQFIEQVLVTHSLGAFVKFARGLIVPESRAMLGLMSEASAQANMETILGKGGSVVHAYGDVDKVSPAAENAKISEELAGYHRYRGVLIPNVGHEGALLYGLNGAFARTARKLVDEPRR